jgi:hypothetical protein
MTLVAGALAKKAIPALGRWSLTADAVTMAAGIWAVAILAGHSHLSTWQAAPDMANGHQTSTGGGSVRLSPPGSAG